MATPKMSINQLAAFSVSTAAGKARIIKQQLKPNPVLIPWYQSAKGSIKKYLKDIKDKTPLIDGLDKQNAKKIESKRQAKDKRVSIEALEIFIDLRLPKLLRSIDYEIVKIDKKNVNIKGVEIGVSPEVIFKTKIDGKITYGGVKIHIGKTDPFDLQQCKYVANILFNFIRKNVADKGTVVAPQLCFCIDVFSERVIAASSSNKLNNEIDAVCEEIKTLWS